MSCLPTFFNIKTIHIYNEHIKDPKYKTEMCKNWEKSGSCPYNNKCRFAHGREELMNKEIEANPNYRARDCLSFFKYGYCNYGRRCCFKHEERRINDDSIALESLVLLKLRNPIEKKRLSIFEDISEEINCTRKKGTVRSTNSTASTASVDSAISSDSEGDKHKNTIASMVKTKKSISEEIVFEEN